jgi:hypothetical protein
VMAVIVERTDGIPLFVEEMTKAVLEADSEGAARRTVAAVPSPTVAVPASLHASLMARLDSSILACHRPQVQDAARANSMNLDATKRVAESSLSHNPPLRTRSQARPT